MKTDIDRPDSINLGIILLDTAEPEREALLARAIRVVKTANESQIRRIIEILDS